MPVPTCRAVHAECHLSTKPTDNWWRLNGVKRFITNGDADIHLVLARSEEGTRDGRGLSMFIYDKRNSRVPLPYVVSRTN